MDALSNRAVEDALYHLDEAERVGHDPCACAGQRWYCWMLLGDFESAWRESDFIRGYHRGNPDCLWDGRPFDGRRVIIRCLHGYGDAIQFIRYARCMRQSAGRIIVECARPLVSLFKCQPYIDEVISWDDGTSNGYSSWDRQIEVMELPRAFRTSLDTIPADVPYLMLPEIALGTSQPRVGLVWGSSDWNPLRSLPFELLNPILESPRVSWFSFQHGDHRAAIADMRNVCDTAPDCSTILDTALLLSRMDLLISADTMVAHLAGALGIPVWLVLPYEADWRWMLDRSDSPWYPGMRLFRQPSPGDWTTPVSAVIAEFSKRFHTSEC